MTERKKKWYEKDLRRLLVDMHIPDWDERMLRDFSAENYAEMMKKANITTAEIYAGSCLGLCFWPTEKGIAHRGLAGRDIFGETVAACRKRGIDVQIYLNVWNRAAHDAHPEWRLILENGKGSCDNLYGNGRFGICCPNTGFGKFFLDELDELNSRYEGVGFWIDMLGWWSILCYCPACEKRYREETGRDAIPRFIDWNDPVFLEYVSCRERWLSEFARKITETVGKRTPERTVTIQSASFLGGWGGAITPDFIAASEFLAGDFTGDSYQQSVVCKLFSAFSAHRPMEFMTPRCETLSHHTTERTFSNLLMRSYAAIANQASFTLIDAIDPRGTLDARFYDHAHKVNAAYRKYEKYVSGSSVPLADVAVYHSFDSQIDTDIEAPLPVERRAEAASKNGLCRTNMAKTFLAEHLLFTFTGAAEKDLSRHPVLILSDASRLSDAECVRLEEYVKNGGKLYASYCTSLLHPSKGMRGDFALSKLFGVHFKGKTRKISYIAPAPGSILGEFCTKDYPVMLDGRQTLLSAAPGTKVEGTLTLPVSDPSENVRFGSAISNPPMLEKNSPALVRVNYGKGQVVYCAGKLEETPYAFQRGIFGGLLTSLRGRKFIETNAPAPVEITVFLQPEKNRFLISLLNLPADLPAAPLSGICVKFNLPAGFRARELLLAPSETPFAFTEKKGSVSFTVPELREFAMFILDCSRSARSGKSSGK